MNKYIDNNDDYRVEITIRYKLNNKYKAQDIVDSLIDKNDNIMKKEHTNRSMWPDKKLVGIKFEMDDKGFSGHISRDSIHLTSENINDIDKLYDMVNNWTENTDIHLPALSNFYLSGYSINLVPKDDMAIVYDSTKCTEIDDFGCVHEFNCNGYISGFKNICSIYFDNKITIQEGKEYLEHCINNNLFIITEKEENEKFLNKISD